MMGKFKNACQPSSWSRLLHFFFCRHLVSSSLVLFVYLRQNLFGKKIYIKTQLHFDKYKVIVTNDTRCELWTLNTSKYVHWKKNLKKKTKTKDPRIKYKSIELNATITEVYLRWFTPTVSSLIKCPLVLMQVYFYPIQSEISFQNVTKQILDKWHYNSIFM